MAFSKTTCSVSREQFIASAPRLIVSLTTESGQELYRETVKPRQFASGSLGWNVSDKATIPLAGSDSKIQIGANLILVGSKSLPK